MELAAAHLQSSIRRIRALFLWWLAVVAAHRRVPAVMQACLVGLALRVVRRATAPVVQEATKQEAAVQAHRQAMPHARSNL